MQPLGALRGRCWAVMLVLAIGLQDGSINGRVITDSGAPVKNAYVESQTGRIATATTDKNGAFRLDAARDVVFVMKDGFLPLAHILKSDEHDLILILKVETPQSLLTFPYCPSGYETTVKAKGEADLVGSFDLRAPFPKSLVHKGPGYVIDTGREEYARSAPPSGTLNLWWGIGAPALSDPEYFLKSTDWSVRPITNHRRGTLRATQSADWRGTLKNGNHWRWITLAYVPQKGPSISRTALFYFDLTEEAASYFDRILDQTCELERP